MYKNNKKKKQIALYAKVYGLFIKKEVLINTVTKINNTVNSFKLYDM